MAARRTAATVVTNCETSEVASDPHEGSHGYRPIRQAVRAADKNCGTPGTTVRNLSTTTMSDALGFLDRSFSLTFEGVRKNLSAEMLTKHGAVWKIASHYHRDVCGVHPTIPMELLVALFSYSLECPNVCKPFNKKCRLATSRGSAGWDNFAYKSL